MILIRAATVTDAVGIAKVHVDTWRTTYRGIVPDEHLAALSVERRAAFWGKFIGDLPHGQHVNVAVDNSGQVVGFSNGGSNRDPQYDYDGELLAIYLLQGHQGSGTGRRLLQESISCLLADGFKRMLVWVLADNAACAFYERMGGKLIGEKMEQIGDKALRELAYGWNVLPARPD